MSTTDLPEKLRESMNRSPGEMAMEFEGRSYPWQFAVDIAAQLEDALAQLGIEEHERVGFIAHTRPVHVAVLWGLIIARRCPSMIYGYQSAEKLATDIRTVRYPLVIADLRDWTRSTIAAAREAGSAGLSLSEDGIEWVAGLEQVGPGAHRETLPAAAVETLSSGTTGDPKRILLSMQNLTASATAAAASIRQMAGDSAGRTPLIVVLPLANISGVYATIPAALSAHPIALLEKFEVNRWLELVRRLRPATADIPPAAMAMLLKSGIGKEDLASVRVIRTGAAPLDPEVHRVYAQDFNIPINLSYGASEFCGVLTTWTMEDLEQYELAKRGSCGRALPGVSLRVVDRDSGEVLGPNCIGLLEAQAERVGPQWIRTSDLVRVDADGFMWFEGRADATIFRGGFKIAPEAVADALCKHPAVRDAAVIGVPDERLGEVPVAAVQAMDDSNPPTAAELDAHARQHLAAYQIPVRFIFLEELPRTPSLKLNIARLKELLTEIP